MSDKKQFRRRFRDKRRYNEHDDKNKEISKEKRVQAEQLTEIEVGITEYVSKLNGFSGVIKARYSDFHVNEIDMEGKIAKLTDTSIPKDFENSNVEADPNELEQSDQVIPTDILNQIKALIECKEANDLIIEMDVTDLTKESRRAIHEYIKKYFGQKIVASTVTKENNKVLQFKKFNKASEVRRRGWPKDKGEYVHFLVYKESTDTLEACYKISDCIKIPSSSFNYAGVKDRRAKTTQWFSVRKVEPWKLIMKTKCLKNIKIGNICFKHEPLKLGQLRGNRFRIALRNVTIDDDHIKKATESLKENGFINYYGLQRFGNDKEVPTYLIGLRLMQGNWKEVCELILKLKTSDDPNSDVTEAKKVYSETQDAKKAFSAFKKSRNKCVESKLLEGLSKNNVNDYVNALENIPRNMRLLYIHAFQSFVWNHMVSKRIKEFGFKPVVGDLVFLNKEVNNDLTLESEDSESKEPENEKAERVKVLAVEDLDNYTIFDVVLPLPGFDIIYPENMKSFYTQLLEEHGLTLEMPRQRVKTYSLSGAYRKIVEQPMNLLWYTLNYDNPNCSLIRSDFEEIRRFKEPESVPNGQYKAIILDISLNSACYATMALREILKIDTSTTSQVKLNNYHEEEKNVVVPQITEDVQVKPLDGTDSLLNDSDKFKLFKQCVFESKEPLKRKNMETADNECKKIKKSDEKTEDALIETESLSV